MAKSATINNGSKVMQCTCKHERMDALLGKGLRLFLWGPKCRGKGPGFTCNVCLRFVTGQL